MCSPKFHTPTLCWDCRNALGSCSWSDGSFTPVEGWQATPNTIESDDDRSLNSYQVISCPLFLPDDPQ